MDIKYKTTL